MANWLIPVFIALYSLGCMQKGYEDQNEDFLLMWSVIFGLACAVLGKNIGRWNAPEPATPIAKIDTRELSSVVCHARNDWYERFEQNWLVNDEGPDCDEHVADSVYLYLTGRHHE